MRDQTVVGIVGCGNIFERYFTGISRFPYLHVRGCADIDVGRAEAAAKTFAIEAWPTVEGMLADPSVDVVVNITPPAAHGTVTMAALAAGKHVYVEKPLAATLAEANEVVACAAATGRRLGCAPDTFLGSAAQTARAAVDDGAVGEPIAVAAFVTHTRAEEWHPDPTIFFQPGGGPLLDMGPYFVTEMVNCLGPVAEVSGATRIGAAPRVVTAPNRLVDLVEVEVATHASAVLRFRSGVVGTVMMSFDVWHHELPYIEIYGTRGALRLADPNGFDGGVMLKLNAEKEWRPLPPVFAQSGRPGTRDQMLRGMGVADLVCSLGGTAPRASAALGYHVLEVLESVETASSEHAVVQLQSTCERPTPVTEETFEMSRAGTPAGDVEI
jgi:predicted dehydrogenase